jgi:hypothetical protein
MQGLFRKDTLYRKAASLILARIFMDIRCDYKWTFNSLLLPSIYAPAFASILRETHAYITLLMWSIGRVLDVTEDL